MRRFFALTLSFSLSLSLSLCGCVTHNPSPTAGKVNSLRLDLAPGTPLGSHDNPVTINTVSFDVTALDENGNVFAQDMDIDVYVSFGGVKTGTTGTCGQSAITGQPLDNVHLTAGVMLGKTLNLPKAFGPTSIWLEHPPSHAVGASPTIYFDNPLIAEVQTPPDPMAQNATFCSQFNNRFIIIDHAAGGGQLVVTSVYSGAFAVTDTLDAANLTPAGSFNSIYVYSFGKPPSYIVPGRVLKSFSGNYSKFVGFTELNFPLFDADFNAPLVVPSELAKLVVDLTGNDLTNQPKLLGAAASPVRFTGYICNPVDPSNVSNWNKFNQLILDASLVAPTCDSFNNFSVQLPGKTLGAFNPVTAWGQKMTVIGMLQNHSGQNAYTDGSGNEISCSVTQPCQQGTCIQGTCYKNAFNFWTILPRTPDDIVSVGPLM
jgi:hypothetical protein